MFGTSIISIYDRKQQTTTTHLRRKNYTTFLLSHKLFGYCVKILTEEKIYFCRNRHPDTINCHHILDAGCIMAKESYGEANILDVIRLSLQKTIIIFTPDPPKDTSSRTQKGYGASASVKPLPQKLFTEL